MNNKTRIFVYDKRDWYIAIQTLKKSISPWISLLFGVCNSLKMYRPFGGSSIVVLWVLFPAGKSTGFYKGLHCPDAGISHSSVSDGKQKPTKPCVSLQLFFFFFTGGMTVDWMLTFPSPSPPSILTTDTTPAHISCWDIVDDSGGKQFGKHRFQRLEALKMPVEQKILR